MNYLRVLTVILKAVVACSSATNLVAQEFGEVETLADPSETLLAAFSDKLDCRKSVFTLRPNAKRKCAVKVYTIRGEQRVLAGEFVVELSTDDDDTNFEVHTYYFHKWDRNTLQVERDRHLIEIISGKKSFLSKPVELPMDPQNFVYMAPKVKDLAQEQVVYAAYHINEVAALDYDQFLAELKAGRAFALMVTMTFNSEAEEPNKAR